MALVYELRRRARGLIAPTLCMLAVIYFGYHGVQGDRGLLAYSKLERNVQKAEIELQAMRAESRRLGRKVALLHPDHVDPDMLDEQVRGILGLAHPDELIIFTK